MLQLLELFYKRKFPILDDYQVISKQLKSKLHGAIHAIDKVLQPVL
jgi:hypothetical protein